MINFHKVLVVLISFQWAVIVKARSIQSTSYPYINYVIESPKVTWSTTVRTISTHHVTKRQAEEPVSQVTEKEKDKLEIDTLSRLPEEVRKEILKVEQPARFTQVLPIQGELPPLQAFPPPPPIPIPAPPIDKEKTPLLTNIALTPAINEYLKSVEKPPPPPPPQEQINPMIEGPIKIDLLKDIGIGIIPPPPPPPPPPVEPKPVPAEPPPPVVIKPPPPEVKPEVPPPPPKQIDFFELIEPAKPPVIEEIPAVIETIKPPVVFGPLATGTRWALYFGNMFLHAISNALIGASSTFAKFSKFE